MRKKNRLSIVIAGMLVGAGIFSIIQQTQQAQACGSTQGAIVSPPTISAQTILWEFQQRGSPAELQTAEVATHIVDDSKQYQIDDAFAVADWTQESQDGAQAVPGTRNIGNITAPTGVAAVGHIFAIYPTWEAGIDAWFALVKRLYVDEGRTDLYTFSLYYVDGKTPQQATIQEQQDATSYANSVQSITQTLRQHEASVAPSSVTGTNEQLAFPSTQTRVAQIPGGSWATPQARQDAERLGVFNCNQTNTMIGAALDLALHLTSDGTFYDRWAPGTPQPPAETLDGITVWCTDFVRSTYLEATGHEAPFDHNAAQWWFDYQHAAGFTTVVAGPGGGFPNPGDFVVLWDNNQAPDQNGNSPGHIAVIVGVQLPQGSQDGFVLVFEGHATVVLDEWPLHPDMSIGWLGGQYVKGYIRATNH